MGNGTSNPNKANFTPTTIKKAFNRLSVFHEAGPGYNAANYCSKESLILSATERFQCPPLPPVSSAVKHHQNDESNFQHNLNDEHALKHVRSVKPLKRTKDNVISDSLADEFCTPLANSVANFRHNETNNAIQNQLNLHKQCNFPPAILAEQIYIALHDYTARVEDDLCMIKGQTFNIIDRSQGYWWYAKCVTTGEMGYVPFNYLAPVTSLKSNEWYFADMRRLQAEQCLMMPVNDHGSFLIRNSESRTGEYSLSIRDRDSVKHYRIRSRLSRANINLRRYYISRQLPFVNIQQLVEHYIRNQSGICCQLGKPCVRSSQPVPFGLSHDLVDKWEIPKSSICLKERIGKGQFGEVYRAVWNGTTSVAVKTLKANFCNVDDFLMEAQTMKRLHHQHLIQLYAVCTQSVPFYLVTELMSKGSLLNFLQSPDGRNLSMRSLIIVALQIASGMAYLESQHYIHRDLAARNVLVNDDNVVKIADFGLARMIQNKEYVAHAGARFPIKWTAPEAANYSRFTVKSDVWSFGILLTEIFTHGRVPYPGMHNAEVLRQVEAGYRMPAPLGCPPELYKLMLDCWAADENVRPSFSHIHTRLEELCDDEHPAYRVPDSTPCFSNDTTLFANCTFTTPHLIKNVS